jgi:hypothetical protein
VEGEERVGASGGGGGGGGGGYGGCCTYLHIGDSPSEQEVGTIEVRQDILSERLLTDVVGE